MAKKELLRRIHAEVRPAPRDRKTGELKQLASA
jgi:hypothetical protein